MKKTKVKCNRCGSFIIVSNHSTGAAGRYEGEDGGLMHSFPFSFACDGRISLETQEFHLCNNCLQALFNGFEHNPLEED